MSRPSSPFIRRCESRVRALVVIYLKSRGLHPTEDQIMAGEGMIYRALFEALYRHLRGRKGDVRKLVQMYVTRVRGILTTAEFLSRNRKTENALAHVLVELPKMNLSDLRAGRHKKQVPPDTVLYPQLEQVRFQLKNFPKRTQRNQQARIKFLTQALNSKEMKAIVPNYQASPSDIRVLALCDPLDIALTVVSDNHKGLITPDKLKKRLPRLRQLAKASLSQLADLLK